MRSAMDRIRHCRRCDKVKAPPRDRMTSLCVECEAETSCKHDNHEGGLHELNWRCAAGVLWFDLTKPEECCMLRTPCRWIQGGSPVKCDKFEPTPVEQCLAWDRAVEESDRRMRLVLPVVADVKREHANSDWHGTVPCPTGCGGTLALSHSAYNGHVWGKCSTTDCVAWME